MYEPPIHPAVKYSPYLTYIGIFLVLIGMMSYTLLWLSLVGMAVFGVGFAIQLYLRRVISRYRVNTNLNVDFLFPETDPWRVLPKIVDMPEAEAAMEVEEAIPGEEPLTPEELESCLQAVRKRSWRRRNAAARLAAAGPSVIPHIIPLLQADHPETRLMAASILRYFNGRAVKAAPALVDLLGDPDPKVRGQAACALAMMGPQASKEAKPAPRLLELLRDREVDVRLCAALALGRIQPSGKHREQTLNALKAMREEDPVLSAQAAATLALHDLGYTDDQTIPLLIRALRVRNPAIALLCAETLGLLGERASEAIPHLVEALPARSPLIQVKVAHALNRLGQDPLTLLPPVISAARSGEPFIVLEALQIIQELGAKARPAVPALVRMLTDRSALNRLFAVRAIAALGEEARPLAPHLRRLLATDPARAVRYHAQKLLEYLGEPLQEPEEEEEEEEEAEEAEEKQAKEEQDTD